MTQVVKRAYRYRVYPTDAQTAQLSRTFRRARLVYNRALDARTRRKWTCPCGATHDRDVNAARNILAAGLVER